MSQQSKKKNISRRSFIRNTAIVGGSFFIIPRHVMGRGYIAPSDKLNIAGIGAGGKGAGDLIEFAKSPNVNIVALCDVDDNMAKQSKEKFPKATFLITAFKGYDTPTIKGATHAVTGMLTIKEKTNEITFDAIVKPDGLKINCEGTAIIDRSKFDVKYG